MNTEDTQPGAGEEARSVSVWQQMGKDHLLHALVLILVVTSIPLFLPFLNTEQKLAYGWLQSSVVLLPIAMLVFWPSRNEQFSYREKSFWKALALGWAFWWVASCLNLFLNLGSAWITREHYYITELLYLAYYICWLAALSNSPHRSTARRKPQSHQFLQLGGSIGLAFCLFFYFILIPGQIHPESYNTWVPSYLFYSGLDLLLILVLIHLSLDTKILRWRLIYGALGISMAFFLSLDFLAAIDYQVRVFWAGDPLVDLLWVSPFVALVIAARCRNYQFPAPVRGLRPRGSEIDCSRILGSPFVLLAIFLLLVHLLQEYLGLIPSELRPIQGLVVVLGLMMFLALAVAENNSLRQLARVAKDREDELEQLRIQRVVDKQSQEAKSRFLGNVSHEMRTPLNGILGMTELMLCSDLSAEQRERADIVYSSGESLLKIIDEMLEYSLLDGQKLELSQDRFNPGELAKQVLDQSRSETEKKHLGLHLELAPEIPRYLVGDAARLRQVLSTIVNNALKFTDGGEVKVRLTVAGGAGDKVRLRCEVEDTGIGFAPGIVQRLFMPLTPGDESTTRRFGGSGLGLAICRQLVEAKGGSIGAFANEDAGATFWFEIDYLHCDEATG